MTLALDRACAYVTKREVIIAYVHQMKITGDEMKYKVLAVDDSALLRRCG